MAHDQNKIEPLPAVATLAEVIDKVNEMIAQINHMWHPIDTDAQD